MSQDGTATIEVELKVGITDLAKQKLIEFLGDKPLDEVGLRVGVIPGGCSGAQYDLQFAEAPESHEMVVEANGVRMFIDPKFAVLLNGITVDFLDQLVGGGFKVENPNATATCGCGKSFA